MNSGVLVSIIITTYKGSDSLPRAINSVLKQSYKDIEIIVVDDNNPKSEERINTEKVMSEFVDKPQILYIQHSVNKNGSAARNSGIKAAHGCYIAFLDDDDYYANQRIEKCVDLLRSNNTLGGVYTGVDIVNSNRKRIKSIVPNSNLSVEKLLLDELVIGTGSNIFIKKEIVDSINGFDETFIRRQDIEFMIRVCRTNTIGFIPEVLVTKSQNSTFNYPRYPVMKSVLTQFFKKFDEDISCLDNRMNEFYYNQYHTLLDIAMYENNKSEIIDALHILRKYSKIQKKDAFLSALYISGLRKQKVVDRLINKIKNRES